MKTTYFPRLALGTTAVLTAALLYAGHGSLAAKPMRAKMKPTKAAAGSVSQGKALVSQFRCNSCHNANLEGKKGFSPSLHLTGAMHDYTAPQFVKLMHTGVTNDGGHVKPPMPVYDGKMTTAQADSLFAYLHTLK